MLAWPWAPTGVELHQLPVAHQHRRRGQPAVIVPSGLDPNPDQAGATPAADRLDLPHQLGHPGWGGTPRVWATNCCTWAP